MTRRQWLTVALVGALCLGGATAWWLLHAKPPTDTLTLYGNVDLRQVELAFNDNDRILSVDAQEGDRL
ncbi:MAG TPA: secretion protein HlyD, partial [Caulobacteraceae bacterium]|nr:secretion protein HlyD [Caulobacteraceae bacterium]